MVFDVQAERRQGFKLVPIFKVTFEFANILQQIAVIFSSYNLLYRSYKWIVKDAFPKT